jgi:hypothetical protein
MEALSIIRPSACQAAAFALEMPRKKPMA